MTVSKPPFQFINPDTVIELAQGNATFLQELVDLYVRSSDGYILELQQALSEHDFTSLYFQAHKVKGVFSFLGALHVALLAGEMEKLATANANDEAINPVMLQLKVAIRNIVHELRDLGEYYRLNPPKMAC
jgi:HPt (histidine-containing phosphotransfer) domain-containing protein